MSAEHVDVAAELLAAAPASTVFTAVDPLLLADRDIAWIALTPDSDTAVAGRSDWIEQGRGADEVFSLPGAERLLVALTVAALAADGRCDPDAVLTTRPDHHADAAAGVLREFEPGKRLRLGEALTLATVVADEVAERVLVELIEDAGIDLGAELATVCEVAGAGALSLTSRADRAGWGGRFRISGSPRGLGRALESLIADAHPGTGLRSTLGLPAETAGSLVALFAAVYDEGDGLAALLPGYGPFSTAAPHLLVDGGRPGERSGGTLVDVCAPFRDGAPRAIVAAVCPSVPDVVDGLPGGYVARKTMAVLGRRIWDRTATGPAPDHHDPKGNT